MMCRVPCTPAEGPTGSGNAALRHPCTVDSIPLDVVQLLLQTGALSLALASFPLDQERAWLMRVIFGATWRRSVIAI